MATVRSDAEDADRIMMLTIEGRDPRGLMAESNLAESSGRIGSEGDWLKGSGKVGDRQQLSSLPSYLFFYQSPTSAMSPSSVRNDGIKGVDTDALSHLGPNVGKPVRRYGFASLLVWQLS